LLPITIPLAIIDDLTILNIQIKQTKNCINFLSHYNNLKNF